MPYEFIIDDSNPEPIKLALHDVIRDFNFQFFGVYDLKKFAIYLKNEQNNLISGIYGFLLKKHQTMR